MFTSISAGVGNLPCFTAFMAMFLNQTENSYYLLLLRPGHIQPRKRVNLTTGQKAYTVCSYHMYCVQENSDNT